MKKRDKTQKRAASRNAAVKSLSEHAPTPWTYQNGLIQGVGTYNIVVDDSEMREQDAAFIVRAANTHDDLLEWVKLHRRFVDLEIPSGKAVARELDRLIRKAEGE